jgi:fumarate reductase subunit C
VPSTWWKNLPFYRFYMLREGTAVPAVWFSLELMYGVFALKHGPETWAGFVGFAKPDHCDPEPDRAGSRAAAYQNLV